METNHVKILKVLAASKTPMLSRQISAATGAWAQLPPIRGQVRTNSILLTEAGYGHVRRAGVDKQRYHNTPAYLWEITPAGREWLDCGQWKLRGVLTAERGRKVAMNSARNGALLEHLDREARIHDWGPETSASDRRKAIREMRDLGCTLQSIADVFGITREYVRLILLGYQKRANGQRQAIGVSGKVNRKGRWVRLEDKS